MGFGERLQREREMRGITLDEIANATKIGTRSLRALEQEDFDKLPGGIFNKGFVRAYARYLGIDEEQAVSDYLTATGEPAHKDPLDSEELKKLEENWKTTRASVSDERKPIPWRGLIALLLVAVLLAGGWHYRSMPGSRYRQWRQRRQLQAQRVPPATRAPVAAPPTPAPVATPVTPAPVATPGAPVPVATAPTQASARPATPAPSKPSPAAQAMPAAPVPSAAVVPDSNGFVVQVRAHQDCWIEIIADGKVVMQGLLVATGERAVRAHEKITLTAGNAGGVEISFNGEPQLISGREGDVRTLTFTPGGLQP